MSFITGARTGLKTEHILSHGVELEPDLDRSMNEAIMFHGTNETVADIVIRSRVRVLNKNASHGDLYGPGNYFAESVTKADSYSTKDDDGLFSIVLNKVALGSIYMTEERNPDYKKLMRAINSKEYNSVCGDRRKIENFWGGWREFIIYEERQSMPLYLVKYKRVQANPTDDTDDPTPQAQEGAAEDTSFTVLDLAGPIYTGSRQSRSSSAQEVAGPIYTSSRLSRSTTSPIVTDEPGPVYTGSRRSRSPRRVSDEPGPIYIG